MSVLEGRPAQVYRATVELEGLLRSLRGGFEWNEKGLERFVRNSHIVESALRGAVTGSREVGDPSEEKPRWDEV